MAELERFGVSMEGDLLTSFDRMIESRGYKSRSEAIRDLVRRELVEQEWAEPSTEVVGTITIVYEHHQHELSSVLADVQHHFHGQILCSTHVHLDEDNCLEVIIARGESSQIRSIADSLISTRGVKHGQLVSATTGRGLV